jgi:hypothetical protein
MIPPYQPSWLSKMLCIAFGSIAFELFSSVEAENPRTNVPVEKP